MPAKVTERGGKFRVIEASSGDLVRNNSGTPADGGGHSTRTAAEKQAAAINANERK